jgi:hypothetical protein
MLNGRQVAAGVEPAAACDVPASHGIDAEKIRATIARVECFLDRIALIASSRERDEYAE